MVGSAPSVLLVIRGPPKPQWVVCGSGRRSGIVPVHHVLPDRRAVGFGVHIKWPGATRRIDEHKTLHGTHDD